jgi:tetratricopeptide (TPR) repeat protein
MKPRPTTPGPSEFDAAVDLARAGRLRDAGKRIEQVLAAGSRSVLATPAALAFAELARQAERTGDLHAAERALARATELRPKFADLQHRHACALLGQGRRMDARRALERALQINPRYVAAKVELALLDARDGLVGEAVSALKSLAEDAPIQDRGAFLQGVKRLEHADWEGADAFLRRGFQMPDPELQERIARYHEHMRAGDCERALAAIEEVVQQHDAYPDLHYLMGTAELRMGLADDALASLGRALELHPEFHDARVRFAQALEAVARIPEAVEQAQWVLEAEPGHAGARALVDAHTRRQPRAA